MKNVFCRIGLLALLVWLGSCSHGYELYRGCYWVPRPGEAPHDTWSRVAIRGAGRSADRADVTRHNRCALRVFSAEKHAIEQAGRNRDIGLALSGGGIRSAAYAMGVLRGLHDSGAGDAVASAAGDSLLSRVGYLSTVSGGGFGGAWYMSHSDDDGLFRAGSRHLQRVVGAGNYLTSSHYSDTNGDLAIKALLHAGGLPFAALLDEVFHLQFNVYGIRDFYRQALSETFLYTGLDEVSILPPGPFERFCGGERTMQQYLPGCDVQRPFWIVNSHLILKDEILPVFRNRSGDAFETTPLWAGARAIDYVRVPERASARQFWMQPDYAIAISGAALDSDSLTLNSPWSLLSYLLNFDLGYWVRSWNDTNPWTEFWLLLTSPFPINRGLSVLFPTAWKTDHRFTAGSKYLGLTDGGHFENLGAYALVRRGVRFIMIADGSQDPLATQWDSLSAPQRGQAFGDLRHLSHLLQLDFGLTLEIDWERFCVDGVPTLLVGEVRGLPDGPLTVVVFKAAYEFPDHVADDESMLEAEKARNPEFPDDPLLRQFFREDRFMAYERLGYLTVERNRDHLLAVLRDALR